MKRFRYQFWALAALVLFGQLTSFGQDLVLTVDLDNNTMVLSNEDPATNVVFDAYTIQSPFGLLNTAGWSSLADNLVPSWNEYGTVSTTLLGETKQVGVDSLVNGTNISLGTPYSPVAGTMAAGFGADILGDLSISAFDATTSTQTNGRVVYVGEPEYNNLVVNVNTDTGALVLENESPNPVTIDAYGIFSTSGSLSTAWNGVRDTDSTWLEIGTASATQLGETNATSAMLLGARFLHWSIRMIKGNYKHAAIKTFKYSITYLMLLFVALLVDHFTKPMLAAL